MHYLLILFIVSLLASSVGFKYFIYFFSIGYGFGIAALAATIAIVFWGSLSVPTAILCLVLFAYGCRLGIYLFKRERKSAAYRKILYDPSLQEKKPVLEVMMVWIFCAILYVAEISPVAFRLSNTSENLPISDVWAWIGAVLMVAGACLEAAADAQKSAAKKVNPKRFVDTGLYKIVRCPNYLGEVTLWTGCFLTCIGASCSTWQWIVAAIGYIGIIYVMFSGARRLELRQVTTYGNDPEYQEYVKKTPILISFLPIYSLAKYKWLQA